MKDIMNLSLQELEGFLVDNKLPKYHAKQIFSWIYKKGVRDFKLMSDLSVGLRKNLQDNFCFSELVLKERQNIKFTGFSDMRSQSFPIPSAIIQFPIVHEKQILDYILVINKN